VLAAELELDLDAFEGPFDLLLTLVLRDEIELADVDLAEVVRRVSSSGSPSGRARSRRLRRVPRPDLALLELKARGLFPTRSRARELEPEAAAERARRRLAEYRRAKEAAVWLAERLAGERDRFFRLGPAPLAPARPEPTTASQSPDLLAAALRCSLSSRRSPRPRTWRSSSLPSRSSSSAGAPCCGAAPARLRPGGGRPLARGDRRRLPRTARAVQAERARLAQAAPFAPIRISRPEAERSLAWNVRSA